MALEYLGVLVDTNAAETLSFTMNLKFTDVGDYLVTVKNGVILYQKNVISEEADVTGIWIDTEQIQPGTVFIADFYGESSYCMYQEAEGYKMIEVMPRSED